MWYKIDESPLLHCILKRDSQKSGRGHDEGTASQGGMSMVVSMPI